MEGRLGPVGRIEKPWNMMIDSSAGPGGHSAVAQKVLMEDVMELQTEDPVEVGHHLAYEVDQDIDQEVDPGVDPEDREEIVLKDLERTALGDREENYLDVLEEIALEEVRIDRYVREEVLKGLDVQC